MRSLPLGHNAQASHIIVREGSNKLDISISGNMHIYDECAGYCATSAGTGGTIAPDDGSSKQGEVLYCRDYAYIHPMIQAQFGILC